MRSILCGKCLHRMWRLCTQQRVWLLFQDFIRYPNIEKKMQAEGLALFGAFEGPQMLGAGGILPQDISPFSL